MNNIYAILPCYNEEKNIGKLIEAWIQEKDELQKKKYELRIIAIDDCSTDNTKKKILEKKNKYENVDIIEHDKNKGLMGGINTALHYFNDNANKGDLLVLMDGDNTHEPKYIQKMVEVLLQGNDCVIASRYRKNSNVVGLAKNRERMSDFAKIYYSVILQIPNVKDYTCGYRVYTYDIIDKLIKKFGKNPIKEKSFACMMELLYKIYITGAKFDEVGFELRYDYKCGSSKMNVLKTAQRSLITAINLKVRYSISAIFCILFLVIFAIFLSLGTNFSPTNKVLLTHDCGIFSYVGFAMHNGRALYSQIWENKGPLLYIIYYLGQAINEKYGVYFLELISIFISLLFGYKTIKLVTNKKLYGILGIIYTFSVWGVTYAGGTYSENFALPILFIGTYLFTKNTLKNNKIQNIEIFIWGILVGIIALLRLNILAIFLGFFIVIGINLIIKKEFKEILRWIGFGILGFTIIIIPNVIYLAMNNSLLDCLNCAYFNVLDSFNSGNLVDKVQVLNAMLYDFNISGGMILILGFTITSVALIINKNITKSEYKLYICGIVVAIIINAIANSIAGTHQIRYMMTFIPILAMCVALSIKLYDKIKINYFKKVIILSVIICLLSCIGYKNYVEICIKRAEKMSEDAVACIINNYLEITTKQDDLVQIIGGSIEAVSANYKSKRLSASKYSYMPLWPTFTQERKKEIANEIVSDIKDNKPKIIMICKENDDENEFNKLIDNKENWYEFLNNNYEEKMILQNQYSVYKRK